MISRSRCVAKRECKYIFADVLWRMLSNSNNNFSAVVPGSRYYISIFFFNFNAFISSCLVRYAKSTHNLFAFFIYTIGIYLIFRCSFKFKILKHKTNVFFFFPLFTVSHLVVVVKLKMVASNVKPPLLRPWPMSPTPSLLA